MFYNNHLEFDFAEGEKDFRPFNQKMGTFS